MEEGSDWDLFAVPGQGTVKTHGTSACAGRPCSVHNPSDHHMREWPMIFDMRKMAMSLRVCDHAKAHPDPDAVTYFARTVLAPNVLAWLLLHECDGCCLPDLPRYTSDSFGVDLNG